MDKIKVLYDYQMFSIQKYGGITRYFTEIIKNLPPNISYSLPLLFTENQHLRENKTIAKQTHFIPSSNFKGKYYLNKFLRTVNHRYSARQIAKNNFDILHPTFYDDYVLQNLKKPLVVTVHDLILYKVKDPVYNSSPRRQQMKNMITKADRIIAISNNTKKDVVEVFNINPDKIDVVYHGFNYPAKNTEENRYGRYVLFVGQRGHHKNFETFIEAIAPILHKDRELKLICVGPSLSDAEHNNLTRLKIVEQVIVMNVNDSTLNMLYAHALLFVYPSLYEGFGMPILEAFANNCPVCLSDASCFPEIAGDAGIYFDPSDRESIQTAIHELMYDEALRSRQAQLGHSKLSEFSWEKAADQTAGCYEKTF